MNIKVFQNRKVSKDYFDNEGTQNENYSTTLSFEVPLGYEDFSKRIVFITEDGNFWDYIKDNEYVIKNNITKYENIEAYLWLTKDNQDFRSETFELNFYENQNPDDMTPSEEQLDGYNTLIAELELKVEEVDTLKEETLEALEKLKEQQIDYENRFEEINGMLKELKDTNEYQSEIIDQFKNEFDEKEFKGANAHLPDSAELPLKLQPQGNIEQEVIEAVEGIVVEGSSINVSDVDTDYEDSIVPKGNIEQDSRVGYNLANVEDFKVSGYSTTKDFIITNGNYTLSFFKSRIAGTTIENNFLYSYTSIEFLDNNGNSLEKNINGTAIKINDYTSKVQTVVNITAPENTYIMRVEFANNNGDMNKNTLVSEVMLLSGTYTKDTLPPYEQFGAMPSIPFPSEVKGVSGHYETLVENKQLLNLSIKDQVPSISTGELVAYAGGVSSDFTRINAKNKYIYSYELVAVGVTTPQYIFFYDKDKKFLGYVNPTQNYILNDSEYFAQANYIKGRVDFISRLKYAQLEVGEVATSNIEHQEQLLPIDIPTGQVWYSGKPYKLNGKWYRDVEWVKLEFTGTESFITSSRTDVKRYYLDRIVESKPVFNSVLTQNVFCNNLKAITSSASDRGELGISNYNTTGFLFNLPLDTEFSTVELFKTKLAELYANGTPLYVVYKLAKPYAEEITDETLIEQLEAHDNAEFYEGVTNINSYKSSEDVADMPLEVHYNFITPAPSVERPSEVLEVGSDEEINYCSEIEVGNINANGNNFNDETSIRSKNYDEIEPNTTYIASLNGNAIGFNYTQYDENKTSLGRNYTSNGIFTTSENAKYVRVQVLASIDNSVVQINKGTEIKPYTPYGYCRYDTKVFNKNWFDGVYTDVAVYTPNDDVSSWKWARGSSNYKGVLIKLNGFEGNISISKNELIGNRFIVVTSTDFEEPVNNVTKVHNGIRANAALKIQKFPITQEDKWLGIWVDSTGASLEDLKLQIEVGDTATEYTPHQEQQFPIDLPIGMKMYNDEFFYKENGKWYRLIKWGKKIINQNSGVSLYNTLQRFRVPISNFISPANNVVADIYCNRLKTYKKSAVANYDSAISGGDEGYNGFIFRFNSEYTTVEQINEYLTENPLEVVYKLATPTIEEITAPILIQELEDISRAFSYYPVTNVNSYKPTVNVADLILNGKYYVSNKAKFKTLEERVSALENETVNE